MNRNKTVTTALTAAMGILIGSNVAATEPCGDFGECKVLVEINASDGDIGFHFLVDGDNLRRAALFNPNHRKLFSYMTRRELGEQYLTETFAESAEPLCWDDPEADPDEEVVTLEEFLERWTPGTYFFVGRGEGPETSVGATELLFDLPAAPAEVDFDGSVISWQPGEDLGNCADFDRLAGQRLDSRARAKRTRRLVERDMAVGTDASKEEPDSPLVTDLLLVF